MEGRLRANFALRLEFLSVGHLLGFMKVLVTSKGQVTIPKALREQFGIKPGSEIDVVAGEDGIRLRKVADVRKRAALGCLKETLANHTVKELMDDLRGSVESS
jgi:AbrB family looped-hinge helix DNA binding protein